MRIKCNGILYVLNLVQQEGNSIKEVQKGWSEMDEVIVMNKGLTYDIKCTVLQTHPHLNYWSYDGSPVDPPDEGFACKKCSVSISFRRATRYRR